jgi:hypothetical protein
VVHRTKSAAAQGCINFKLKDGFSCWRGAEDTPASGQEKKRSSRLDGKIKGTYEIRSENTEKVVRYKRRSTNVQANNALCLWRSCEVVAPRSPSPAQAMW